MSVTLIEGQMGTGMAITAAAYTFNAFIESDKPVISNFCLEGMRGFIHALGFIYEDELPEDISKEEYDMWFKSSFVDGVRIGPNWRPK